MKHNDVFEEAVYFSSTNKIRTMKGVARAIMDRRSDIADRYGCGFVEAEHRPESGDVVVRFYKYNGALEFEETIGYIAEAVDWLRQYTGNKAIKLV